MSSLARGLLTFLKISAVILLLDILVVLFGLAQIVVEGRTGYWHPFWRWQAEKIIQIIE